MKNALVAIAALTTAASASEPTFTLRGVEKAPMKQAAAKPGSAPTQAAEAVPARKVRAVLASLYGNGRPFRTELAVAVRASPATFASTR